EGGVTPANVDSLTPGSQNLCETLAPQDLLPRQEYSGLAFTSNLKVTGTTEIFFDGFYSRRDFERASGYATGSLVVPNTNAFFVDPSGTSPDSITVTYSFADDIPTDDAEGKVTRWGLTAGLAQQLPGEWIFDALVTYGENNEISNTWRGLNAPA